MPTSDVPRVPFNTVELGAGDGHKSLILLKHFVATGRRSAYTSIDISEGALHTQASMLLDPASELQLGPGSPLEAVNLLVADNIQGVRSLTAARRAEAKVAASGTVGAAGNAQLGRSMVMFLGSSIGNLDDEAIAAFLTDLWLAMAADDLLMVGFDLRKTPDMLSDAYNDTAGVTAEFNYNLLRRINVELDADFDPDAFHFHSW